MLQALPALCKFLFSVIKLLHQVSLLNFLLIGGCLCDEQDRTACIWRLPDLVSVVVLKGHKRGIWSVEFSPVEQCVITASGDKTIKIWSISDGSCLKTFEGHTSSVLRASFLTRGTQFVSCGNVANSYLFGLYLLFTWHVFN